jgi:hypothetical protein
MIALTVVEPQSSGIGGGGFYVRSDAQGSVETLDGRETAPMAASGEWFYRDGKPLQGARRCPAGAASGSGQHPSCRRSPRRARPPAVERLFAPCDPARARRVRDQPAVPRRADRLQGDGRARS